MQRTTRLACLSLLTLDPRLLAYARMPVPAAVAAAWFKYELSPITVQLTEEREPLTSFIVSVCAVVGGVFTVMGLVDAVVHHTSRKLALMRKLR